MAYIHFESKRKKIFQDYLKMKQKARDTHKKILIGSAAVKDMKSGLPEFHFRGEDNLWKERLLGYNIVEDEE